MAVVVGPRPKRNTIAFHRNNKGSTFSFLFLLAQEEGKQFLLFNFTQNREDVHQFRGIRVHQMHQVRQETEMIR